MSTTPSVQTIVNYIRDHRCFSHPIFEHWSTVAPGPTAVGALFHQIQNFCASTRPGRNFPEALGSLKLDTSSHLLQEIVESEENHGPELATMAGYIMNRAAGAPVNPDLDDQAAVEAKLKQCSDDLLGSLPGYIQSSGLLQQVQTAIEVFERRESTAEEITYKNLGTALALEMISNRHLIPGEKICLIDSGLYEATLEDAEMHYLLEHWGEAGAEEQHEKNAVAALDAILDERTFPLAMEGARDFLESLVAVWDVLDSALLASGQRRELVSV
ncbi:hypothetical protein [Pseudonocardia sp. ICBG1293]|uniref:hypothetical protein n=1 Tax=Pseudonocardia sp. ICBG1293 TaxID=2844382 RepID=UPI001CCA7DB7|nr:hypothetical protein [Pseudonocardia sp. ICBG1293]